MMLPCRPRPSASCAVMLPDDTATAGAPPVHAWPSSCLSVTWPVLPKRSFEGEDLVPFALHIDDGPAFGDCIVPGLVELADLGVAVVRVLARRIGVVDEAHEARPVACGGPLQH